jgi:hypothetical protein
MHDNRYYLFCIIPVVFVTTLLGNAKATKMPELCCFFITYFLMYLFNFYYYLIVGIMFFGRPNSNNIPAIIQQKNQQKINRKNPAQADLKYQKWMKKV